MPYITDMKYVVTFLCVLFLCGCSHTPKETKKDNTYSALAIPSGLFRFNHVDGRAWMFLEGRWMPIPDMSLEDAEKKIDDINRRSLQQLRRPQGL
jgi:hypothetical protein